jgi:hypothetical protein
MNMIREKNRKEWTGVKRPGKEPMFVKNKEELLPTAEVSYYAGY